MCYPTILLNNKKRNYIPVKHGKLYYQKFGEGNPIIILHGGPGLDQSYLLPQMLDLSKDHEIILYDQRGSGKSLGTPLTLDYINIDRFCDDLETLSQRLGIKQFTLVGHSWGSTLAIYYAIKHQNHLHKLILLNTAPVDYASQKLLTTAFSKKTAPIKNKITALTNYKEFKTLSAQEILNLYHTLYSIYFYDQLKLNELTLHINKKSADSGFQVMRLINQSSLGTSFNLLPMLKNIKVPTLIINGEQDLIPSKIPQQIKSQIPNSQLVFLAKCGHFSFVEQPAQLFAMIRVFLQ